MQNIQVVISLLKTGPWCSTEIRLLLLLPVRLPSCTVMVVRFGISFAFLFFILTEIQDTFCLYCHMQITIIFKTYSTLHIQNTVETFAVVLTSPV